MFKYLFSIIAASLLSVTINAQIVKLGDASYTTSFPGTDAAGRNSYPSGSPQLSGNALNKPVPTNDWWSKLVKENFADNLFNYPFTMKTVANGLIVSYIKRGVIDDMLPVVVGVNGLNTTKTTVSDFSDWLVTMNWNDGSHFFEASSGIAMPFLYFKKGSQDLATVTINSGIVTVKGEMILIKDAKNGADFAIYAPQGSTWNVSGKVYSSNLNGKNYWSLGLLPYDVSNLDQTAEEFKKYAYVFPKNTTSSFSYDESNSTLTTQFNVVPELMEGENTKMLLGLLPHQWNNLSTNVTSNYSYPSIRGEIKVIEANDFQTEYKFRGILPTLPYVNNYSDGFNPVLLNQKIQDIENDQLALWTDSYNEGQVMNRLIQTARIANEMGNFIARDKIIQTIKTRLEDWLTFESGEKAFLFYYNSTWSAMLGYPAGHGQDSNLNDHHFHWGYFIHAAAFVQQFEPAWSLKFGEMVNLLIRDAASTDRSDPLFPYLRNFSPYAGHCWANGFATFPQGNDQESTSESMQFNSSLIHWGQVTGNKNIRDLGIYLYVTEQAAIQEYWFDVNDRNFPNTQNFSLVSRVWGNDFDNGTFWTSDIAASYGIELYPIHGGSLYLAHNRSYLSKLWTEIKANTGILSNQANVNLWHDVMWSLAALNNPSEAIDLYNSYPDRSLKFGISDAQTYQWIHALNVLGQPSVDVTADYPIAVCFDKEGVKNYAAHNYSSSDINVTFSDGYVLKVPAGKMVTNKQILVAGTINASFNLSSPGGSVQLQVDVTEGVVDKVELYNNNQLISTATSSPYTFIAESLQPGVSSFYAKLYQGENFNVTNLLSVQVGEQYPYNKQINLIPGIIEPGKFDQFDGASASGISYLDLSKENLGDFRLNESVDVANHTTEGATVGWIDAGEWLEYTVNVQQSGVYDFSFRYASGNSAGGGPFLLEMDHVTISSEIPVPTTSNWNVWATKTVKGLNLIQGEHVLRFKFISGEFNLGKCTFTRTADLSFSHPIAVAGNDAKIVLPVREFLLDGSASTETASKNLTYQWSQVFGPSHLDLRNANTAKYQLNNLLEGMYKFRLEVSNNESVKDFDDIILMVTQIENIPPIVNISNPVNNQSYKEGDEIVLSANASDFENELSSVEFYANEKLIGVDDQAPYSVTWKPEIGGYQLIAKAYDKQGGLGQSEAIAITVAEVKSCLLQSKEASQGSFDLGFINTYETVNKDVTITWELLDNKSGVVAYLWSLNPFTEKPLTQIGPKKFEISLANQEIGSTLNFACKFAFAGGMSVTKYISYKVGQDCSTTATDDIDFELQDFNLDQSNQTISSNRNKDAKITVFDYTGKMILSAKLESYQVFDLKVLSTGFYLITIESENSILSRIKFYRN